MFSRSLFLLLLSGVSGVMAARQSLPPSAPAPAPPQPPTLLRVVSEARTRAIGRKVKDWALPVGRAVFRFEEGDLTEVHSGNRLVGHFFQGRGHLDYRSEDKVEAPVFEFNVSRNTSLKTVVSPAGLTVSIPFKNLMLWSPSTDVPGLPVSVELPQAAAVDTAFLAHQTAFRPPALRNWGYQPTAQLSLAVAQHLGNTTNAPFLAAEFESGQMAYYFQFDPSGTRKETLSTRKSDHWIGLSDQPLGWNYKQPPPAPFLLTHLDIDITATSGTSARYSATQTFVPIEAGQRMLLLDFWNSHPAIVLDPAAGGGSIRLLAVKDEQGKALPFAHQGHQLLVEFPTPLPQGQPVKISLQVEGEMLYRPRQLNFWQLGVAPWFPQPGLGGQYYTVRASLKVPKPFVPVLPGQRVASGERDGLAFLETRIDKPIQFFVADAGLYETYEDARPGLTVRVITYHTEGRNQKRLANLSHQIIDFYEEVFGPFPFSDLNLIQQLDYGFGQAPPGTMYITREAFNAVSDDIARAFAKGINERIAHEIAHQYWGHVVKMGSWEEQWITEAFSEYASGLAMRQAKGKGEPAYKEMAEKWLVSAKEGSPIAPIPLANRIHDSTGMVNSRRVRQQLLYFKGARLLFDLHARLGDKDFFTFLWNYQSHLQWKFGTTQNMVELLQAITGKDHGPWFEEHYWGTKLP